MGSSNSAAIIKEREAWEVHTLGINASLAQKQVALVSNFSTDLLLICERAEERDREYAPMVYSITDGQWTMKFSQRGLEITCAQVDFKKETSASTDVKIAAEFRNLPEVQERMKQAKFWLKKQPKSAENFFFLHQQRDLVGLCSKHL